MSKQTSNDHINSEVESVESIDEEMPPVEERSKDEME